MSQGLLKPAATEFIRMFAVIFVNAVAGLTYGRFLIKSAR